MGMESNIAPEIIKGSFKEYDFKAQKGALIWRSEHFSTDMGNRTELIRCLPDYCKENGGIEHFFKDLSIYGDNYSSKAVSYGIALTLWSEFCDHWDISWKWSGKEDDLSSHIIDIVDMRASQASSDDEYSGDFHSTVSMEASMSEVLTQMHDEGLLELHPRGSGDIEIIIKADTTRDSLIKAWPEIEKLQKRIYPHKYESNTNFARDICWYDLKKKCGLSIRGIADIWVRYHEEDAKILALPKYRKDIRKQMAAKLPGRTSILDNDKALLKEIEAGVLKAEFLDDFRQHMDTYLKGKVTYFPSPLRKDKQGSVRPLFHDLIKEAIKRIEKSINMI
jgi:hypothetical protein